MLQDMTALSPEGELLLSLCNISTRLMDDELLQPANILSSTWNSVVFNAIRRYSDGWTSILDDALPLFDLHQAWLAELPNDRVASIVGQMTFRQV
jgi:hypothetical protein